MRTFALAAVLLLGACAQGITHARQAKDTEATVLKAAVCAMSIGAYHRANTVAEQRALDVLCGGEAGPTINLRDLLFLRDGDE